MACGDVAAQLANWLHGAPPLTIEPRVRHTSASMRSRDCNLTGRFAREFFKGLRKVELVVKAKHLGEFLVREAMSGEQLSSALNPAHEGIASRRFAREGGEFFRKLS